MVGLAGDGGPALMNIEPAHKARMRNLLAQFKLPRAERAQLLLELAQELGGEPLTLPSERACQSCGKPLLSKRTDARYCCDTCRRRANRAASRLCPGYHGTGLS